MVGTRVITVRSLRNRSQGFSTLSELLVKCRVRRSTSTDQRSSVKHRRGKRVERTKSDILVCLRLVKMTNLGTELPRS